jgi:aminoglycoside 3-N-acetyltransferase
MISYRDLVGALRRLGLRKKSRVIAHVATEPLGPVQGGDEAILGALLACSEAVLMPAFTQRCLAAGDGVTGGETYHPDLPPDESMGSVVECLRLRPEAYRSMHPLLSFVGVNMRDALEAQTLTEPLGPIGWLAEYDGDVLLLGADQTANVSLHYAERLAGRRQFTRWALTPEGAVECPGIPGCSFGFGAIAARLDGVRRRELLGRAVVEVFPLRDLLNIAAGWIRQDPRALLCDRPECEQCRAVRASVRA